MPRAPRIEFPGAVYHVTTRGIRQDDIFRDDDDRRTLLSILAESLQACDAHAFAMCLMDNHYHVVLQTRQANLSTVMHRLNSRYSQEFNQRHDRCGHVFESRYKLRHIDRDAYLLAVCRYVDLNRVRAGLVENPGDWRWSSYRAHVGLTASPSWLSTDELHGALMGRVPEDAGQLAADRSRYAEWVEAGRGIPLWKEARHRGLYLGDEGFVERIKRCSVGGSGSGTFPDDGEGA